MTNTLDFDTMPAAGPAPTPSAPASATRPPRRRGAGHIVSIVAGSLLLLPALGLVVGGGAVAIAQAVATDDDGYFNTTFESVESSGVAVTTTDLWFDGEDATPWLLDWIDLDLRLQVDDAAPDGDVFVGIARSSDVERYLAGASHSNVTDIVDHTPRYRQVEGGAPVAPPADQDFWVATASGTADDGTGGRRLDWHARGGRWSIVVMNADGSPGVDADVAFGARSDAVTPIAVTMLVVGGILTISAIVLIVMGARGRRRTPDTVTQVARPTAVFAPPSPNDPRS